MICIRGDGVAANTCARLCERFAIPVSIERSQRSRIPALLISDASQKLFADIFGSESLFEGARTIDRRVVAWGTDPIELPHSAVVIGEAELEARLENSAPSPLGDATWTIFTANPLPAGVEQLRFGTRIASASRIQLKDGRGAKKCWIEALENGWVFLLPEWLLAVGAPAEELLGKSRLIADQIEHVEPASGTFPAHPRILEPLTGPDWMACGSAGMAFDPICGDGAGNATREAILAIALICAASQGEPVDDLLAHYRARLVAGFARHLELCRPFYAAITGDWWRAETEMIDRGLEWCRERLLGHQYRYQLRGFELVPISSSARMRS